MVATPGMIFVRTLSQLFHHHQSRIRATTYPYQGWEFCPNDHISHRYLQITHVLVVNFS